MRVQVQFGPQTVQARIIMIRRRVAIHFEIESFGGKESSNSNRKLRRVVLVILTILLNSLHRSSMGLQCIQGA